MTRRLNVLGRAWTVRFCSPVFDDGKTVRGLTDGRRQLIQIDDTLPDDQQRSVLLHELLHASLEAVANRHPEDEEECVQALETGLFAILRANRWAARFIMGA